MDFGSSHVYAATSDPSESYYSSVPNGKADVTIQAINDKLLNTEPLYECIGELKKEQKNNTKPGHVYDAVAGDFKSNSKTAYDEIPPTNQPPPIPEKPDIYKSQVIQDNTDDLPLSVQLRLALEEREEHMQKENNTDQPSLSPESRTSIKPQVPMKPPRTKRKQNNSKSANEKSTTTPTIPKRKFETVSLNGLANPKNSDLATDCLIDFEKPILPPPITLRFNHTESKNPFGDLSPNEMPPSSNFGLLKPTVVNESSNENGLKQSNKSLASSVDATTSTNIFLIENQPPKATKSNPYVSVQTNLKEKFPNGDQNSSSFNYSKNLFEEKIKSCKSVKENDLPTVPSAPLWSDSMSRSESKIQTSILTNNYSNNHPPLSPKHDLPSPPILQPSAPPLTASMKRKESNARLPSKTSGETYSLADTNVVCIKFGILADNRDSFFAKASPVQCTTCRAIKNNTDGAEKWECAFCGDINKSCVSSVPPSSSHDVTYPVQLPVNLTMHPESLIVFCVDISGSMCVTTKVDSNGNSLFVSRLKGLQQAIVDQLNLIEAERPHCRVALVTFNDSVHLLGDGSPEQSLTLNEYQLFDFDYLSHIGYVAPMPGLISSTRYQLSKAVLNLKESGGTALGPALLLSTALASKLPGSQVIVCTDGRANIGIGSLETESDYSMCHHFYDQATYMATSRGVIVSVMAISGSDCRLVQLGKIADKTAGKVNIVEASKLSEEFGSILSDNVLATNVSIDLVTHRHLYFESKSDSISCNIAQFVGNITQNTEITLRYGVRRDEEFSSLPPPREAPFQLKICYRALDGGIYIRVLTQIRPVTENKELAESEMNPAVIGTFATQSAAKLALQGDIETAKEITNAHKVLVSRGMSLKSYTSSIYETNESVYESVKKRMDDIGDELEKADQASFCSSETETPQYKIEQEQEEVAPSSEQAPPALPPRRSNSTQQLSMSTLESVLSKFPSIPKTSSKKKKKKRNKTKTAMQYKDNVAVKMFGFSNASTSAFSI